MRPRRVFADVCLAAALFATRGASGQTTSTASTAPPLPEAPLYTAASLANTAANVAGFYAPNSFLTIYGQNLAYVIRTLAASDIHAGQLPVSLSGASVGVIINQAPADLYYVSPGQVNVLIPSTVAPGPNVVQLQNQSLYGPPITINVSATAPVLFQTDPATIVATHGNGPLVTSASPAEPNEIVVLYATGLGPVTPALIPNQIPTAAAWIVDRAGFQVALNGTPVDPILIQYAGLTPGFAGLYQINLQLPVNCPQNPQIQIGYRGALSPSGRILPVSP